MESEVTKLATKTSNAYSVSAYSKDEWVLTCEMLLQRYNFEQAEGILRSKCTRWCRDDYSKNGEGKAKYLEMFLDNPRNQHNVKSINALINEK